ncbi:hypothetical protein A3F00_03180 [Candidatus Daviesbacteria bacterium RIFCSPHIGHO2_12_FULL_37_11]|uniref:ZIP zinc transporter n=1 Tax=Candidatus Daviesbacteria bacterium RIFCSPHIGHO2_12_FULL_37_11 TaxID=1797777 RepID=A0A1F5KB30_9BACT|nr:MAG: hypothetical protein A2111_02150 [Candidatus Daviesbacteria bacterium GWA1_38_6]OGE37821.1 MAG: hypothetical protein A3F00_03180 [Candidatus Daviesbacteria bacterium RIFCSPHIGHO2_12_FULL_37_11]
MDTFSLIIVYTLVGSIVSLCGGILLLSKEKLAKKIAHYLSSFAAGVLLATAFVDLLPEALDHAKEAGLEVNIFLWTLFGILVFFLLERFIHWFHHHHDHKEVPDEEKKTVIPLIILGDTMHNFIDGVVIAATFMVDPKLGALTTFAVAAHEIPQEIGDFGIMLHRGMKKKNILLVNIGSAFAAILGAILTYFIGGGLENILPIFLSLAAGFFIYIALSDLIPEIHGEDRKDVAFWETVLLFSGVAVIWIFISALEGV